MKKRGMGDPFTGSSLAMDGQSAAYTDVLVAIPVKGSPMPRKAEKPQSREHRF